MTGRISGYSPAYVSSDKTQWVMSQFDMTARGMIKKPYLFDEGSAMLSFAFLFEDLPGAGAALL